MIISINENKIGSGILFCNYLPDGTLDRRISHKEGQVPLGLFKYAIHMYITGTYTYTDTNNTFESVLLHVLKSVFSNSCINTV